MNTMFQLAKTFLALDTDPVETTEEKIFHCSWNTVTKVPEVCKVVWRGKKPAHDQAAKNDGVESEANMFKLFRQHHEVCGGLHVW